MAKGGVFPPFTGVQRPPLVHMGTKCTLVPFNVYSSLVNNAKIGQFKKDGKIRIYDIGFALFYKKFPLAVSGVWLEMLESMWRFSEVN